MDIETRLELLETRNTLLDLISGYAQGFDNHEPELLKWIFHDHAVLDLGELFGRHEGIDAILAVAEDWWAGAPHMHHWMANPLLEIDLEAGTATGRYALNCLSTFVESCTTHIGGQYEDRFERIDGRWAITECKLEFQFVTPLPNWVPEQGTEAPTEVQATA